MIFIQFEAMPTQEVAMRGQRGRSPRELLDSGRRCRQGRGARTPVDLQEGWVVVSVKQWRRVDIDAETRGPDAEYILEALKGRRFDDFSPMVAGG